MAKTISFFTVREGQEEYGIDHLRHASIHAFNKVFKESSTLGAGARGIVVALDPEQIKSVESGKKLTASELGVFSTRAAAQASAEAEVLKTQNQDLEAQIEALKAQLEASQKAKSTRSSNNSSK